MDQDTSGVLGLVLAHLSSRRQQQDALPTARYLHRVSQAEQATARSTLRHLPLDQYYKGRQAASACEHLPPVPWDLLAASPGVTSWRLHPEQVQHLVQGPGRLPAAAAVGRLKALALEYSGEQVWQLLAACTSLQALDMWTCKRYRDTLLHEPGKQLQEDASSTGTTAAAAAGSSTCSAAGSSGVTSAATGGTGGAPGWPTLPALKVLKLTRLNYASLAPWVQLQQGRGLEELHLDRCGPFVAQGGTLQHFSRLRSLVVDHKWCHRPPPKGLRALTSLTRLGLLSHGLEEVPAAVLALTGLRSLDLSNNHLSSLGSVSALKQLSELSLGTNYLLREVPADLGVQLPALRVLRVDDCSLSTGLPYTLHALSRLEVGPGRERAAHVRGEQLGALSSLRHLALTGTTLHNPGSLSLLTGLRVLSLVDCGVAGVPCRPGQLAGLRHLCRFHQCGGLMRCGVVMDLSAFVEEASPASPPLQHLTHLFFVTCIPYNGPCVLEQLPTLGTLPRLQQLTLYGHYFTQLAPLGPWLAQQTALTQLCLSLDRLVSVDELRHLPQQLLELSVTGSHAELPLCLTRLSALKKLGMCCTSRLKQLPGWLSCLSRLEVLKLNDTAVTTQQEVLAALPLLRQVKLSDSPKKPTPTEVLASAPHLLFAPSE